MGQDASKLVDENTPPETLESRTVDSVAKFIKDGRAGKIVVMVSLRAEYLRSPAFDELARPALEFPRPLVYQTFDHQTPVYTPI